MPLSSKHMEEDLQEFHGIQLYDPKTSFALRQEVYVPVVWETRIQPKIHRPNKFWSWLLRKFTTPSCIK